MDPMFNRLICITSNPGSFVNGSGNLKKQPISHSGSGWVHWLIVMPWKGKINFPFKPFKAVHKKHINGGNIQPAGFNSMEGAVELLLAITFFIAAANLTAFSRN